jgi:hypothetical protein
LESWSRSAGHKDQPLFTKITTGTLVTDRNYNWFPSWGDYDNDGDLDLFVTARYKESTAALNQFYRNNGDGSFTRLAVNEAGDFSEDSTWSSMGLWLDYDRDGDLDFFLNGPYGITEQSCIKTTVMGHSLGVGLMGLRPHD